MNKLKGNLYVERPWGSEIIWALTDDYIAKTVEIKASSKTSFIVHQEREKSIIVIRGPLYLMYGQLLSEELTKAYKLSEGWSWHIDPGHAYQYIAMENPVMLIEVSSANIDDGHIIIEDGSEISENDFIEPPL